MRGMEERQEKEEKSRGEQKGRNEEESWGERRWGPSASGAGQPLTPKPSCSPCRLQPPGPAQLPCL